MARQTAFKVQRYKTYLEFLSGGSLKMGTSGSPMSITTTAPSTLYTTSAYTSTSTVRSMIINQVQTAASSTNQLEALRVTLASEYQTGSWANAIVGRIDYGTAGDATGGMCAPICSELNYPAKDCHNLGGGWYVLDLEMNCPENFVCGTSASYPNAFMNIAIWGHSTAIGLWEDYGFLFRTDGFTSASGNMYYANTFRVRVGSTTWYLPMSSAEGSYTTAYPIVSTYAGKALSITSALSGSSALHNAEITTTDSTATTSGDASSLHLATTISGDHTGDGWKTGLAQDYTITGNSTYAFAHSIYIGGCGDANITNMSAIFVYMDDIGGSATVTNRYGLDLNIDNGDNATPCGFIRCYNHGGASTTMDYVLDFANAGHGVADYFIHFGASGGLLESGDTVSAKTPSYGLRCSVAGTPFVIPLYSD